MQEKPKKKQLEPIVLPELTQEESREMFRRIILEDVKRILRIYPNDIKRGDTQAALLYALGIGD